MKLILENIWLRLKGNKTIILLILLNCLEAGLIPLTGGWYKLAKIIIMTLGGGALYDHYKSGNFKKSLKQ